MNDIANLCERVGANINHVRQGIGSDPRIGNKFIYPGIGYGGSCFPKDVKALIHTGEQYNYPLKILQAVDAVNNAQKKVLAQKINQYFQHQLQNKVFALWGLSFKPHTNDMREAPSLVIIEDLLQAGAKVQAYDPVAMKEAKQILGNKISYAHSAMEAVKNADALLLITEWPEFRLPDWEDVYKAMKTPVIFDGRNIYNSSEMRKKGFTYFGIGLPENK
jgi:UDPglucose 6-dehydrogenase